MKKILLLSALFLTIVSCSTQNVAVDYNRDFDFETNRTYSFTQTRNLGLNDLDSARLYSSIEKGMLYRGFQKSNEGSLTLDVKPEEFVSKQQNSNVGIGMGTGGYGFGGGVSVGIPIMSQKLNQNYTISMKDEGRLVWEGTLKIQMPLKASPEVRAANIQKGVTKLLQKFPPKKK